MIVTAKYINKKQLKIEVEIEFVLQRYGLNKNEIKVYLCLIDLGEAQAGRISRQTGIHRRNVYDATERLIAKGLVNYLLKNNKRLFSPVNPQKLLEEIEERQQQLKTVLPELEKRYNRQKKKEETSFYKGRDAVKAILEDQIKEGKEILVLGATGTASKKLPFYFKWYHEKRQAKKIPIKYIVAKETRFNPIPLSKIKKIDEKFVGDIAFNVYGDKVALVFWNEEVPSSLIIKGEKRAEAFRKIFNFYWKHSN